MMQNTFLQTTCNLCGALIGDMQLHFDWHTQVALKAKEVDTLQGIPFVAFPNKEKQCKE